MGSEKVTAFLQEHWYIVSAIVGVVLLIGAICNWNWLCDPTGAPHSHRYGHGSRRVIFFLLGILLIVVSIWGFVLSLK
ncbi:MAG: immunity 17 family protein [Ruminococcus bicirculans (ex Wegman et al. 2014)]|uniref:immunity 17 family protein n=1 Tax=Ruminococcus bicirculans (ex Wegman et al. 2014) TaxID=1160721 RepID=UPI00399B2E30